MHPVSFTSLIVTYNSANEIAHLLDDLHVHGPAGPVLVIDNASTDGTAEIVDHAFPAVRLLRNSTNLGYARAVNQGFEICETDYVLLLNPDIRIRSSKLFAELEHCLDWSPEIAAAAPLQFKDDGESSGLNFTWSYASPESFRIYLSHLLGSPQRATGPVRVTYLNAGCLFLRRSAFERVGRLTEKYFLYGEEPDLFLKFKRHGFRCYLLPGISVTHYRERSFRTRPLAWRLATRFRAVCNITDAFLRGWTRILLDAYVSCRVAGIFRRSSRKQARELHRE